MIACLALAAAIAAAGLALAGTLLSSGGQSPGPSTAVPTEKANVVSLEVWNPERRQWQTTSLDASGRLDQSPTFLLVVDDTGARSHNIKVSFECHDSRPARLIALSDPLAAITEPGPGRLRPDSTALAGVLAAWSATFPEPPSWSSAITCADSQILEFAMTQLGDPAHFMWQVEIPARAVATENVELVVGVSVDGYTAQSLTIQVGP